VGGRANARVRSRSAWSRSTRSVSVSASVHATAATRRTTALHATASPSPGHREVTTTKTTTTTMTTQALGASWVPTTGAPASLSGGKGLTHPHEGHAPLGRCGTTERTCHLPTPAHSHRRTPPNCRTCSRPRPPPFDSNSSNR
jgi:hypothetical protein